MLIRAQTIKFANYSLLWFSMFLGCTMARLEEPESPLNLYLYYVPDHNSCFLVNRQQRYLQQWNGKSPLIQAQKLHPKAKPVPLPDFLNLDRREIVWGPGVDATLYRLLMVDQDSIPPFTGVEVKQSANRAKNKNQYKRLIRETVAEIEAGYMKESQAFLGNFLQHEPEDPEAWYAKALWLVRRYRYQEAGRAMDKAVGLGLPAGRFLSGSPLLWQEFWGSEIFETWLSRQSYSPLLNGPLLGDVGADHGRIRLKLWSESPAIIQLSSGDQTTDSFTITSTETGDGPVVNQLVQIRNMRPETTYQYEVWLGSKRISGPHQFRTSAAKGEASSFTIAFGGGAGYTPWKERMWDTILRQQPEALLLLGDNVYIDHPERPATQQYCYARRQHRPEWRRLVAQSSVYTIWDDHDFTYNDAGGGPEVNVPYWKKDVWNLFQQQWANPAYGVGEETPGCFYSFSRGEVDFFMLDTRYYREAPQRAGASILGEKQKVWLKEQLIRSDARFKIICSSVPMAPNTKPGSLDTWDGYAAERQELFDFFTENEISGIMLLAADRHRSDLWKIERKNAYPLYEMMSSRLTNVHVHKLMEGSLFGYNELCSFGLLSFDTKASDPTATYRIVNIENDTVFSRTFLLSTLQ